MVDRLVVVVTSPRVAPGLLAADAWAELRAGPVLTARPDHPQRPALAAAGIPVTVVSAGEPAEQARVARERARTDGRAVWLAEPGGDEAFARALGRLVVADAGAVGGGLEGGVEMEVVHGSYDLPGARLLDVVATMDRLRSPGGCPWDAKQTHATLGRYLLEEAYEAYEAIETAQTASYDDLREELGDVLLQVVFHARVAQERGEQGWTIDDVARGLVDKLVRRHPHVFGDVRVSGADEVVANWEAIKETEKARASATEGVPLSQPALALASALQKRAASVGLPVELLTPDVAAAETLPRAVAAAAARLAASEEGDDRQRDDAVGELLFTAVALARSYAVDPESALRRVARRFRERLATVEADLRADGRTLGELGPADWRQGWSAAVPPEEAEG